MTEELISPAYTERLGGIVDGVNRELDRRAAIVEPELMRTYELGGKSAALLYGIRKLPPIDDYFNQFQPGSRAENDNPIVAYIDRHDDRFFIIITGDRFAGVCRPPRGMTNYNFSDGPLEYQSGFHEWRFISLRKSRSGLKRAFKWHPINAISETDGLYYIGNHEHNLSEHIEKLSGFEAFRAFVLDDVAESLRVNCSDFDEVLKRRLRVESLPKSYYASFKETMKNERSL
jgi:hypothetical protein